MHLVLGQCAWLGLFLVQLAMTDVYELSDEQSIDALSVFLGLFALWVFWSWRAAIGHLVDLYSFFFTTLLLFSGGQALLNVFGLLPRGMLNGQFPAYEIRAALTLVIWCLLGFHTGALLNASRYRGSVETVWHRQEIADVVRQVGLILVLISVAPALYELYLDASAIQTFGYGGQFYLAKSATGIDAWTKILSMFLVPGALLLLSGSKGMRMNVIVAWLAIAGPAISYFLLGIRNVGVRGLVALLWLHSAAIRPIRMWVVALAGFSALLLIPGLAAVRSRAFSIGGTLESLQQAYATMDNPLVLALTEMGGTLLTVVHTMNLVPAVRPHEWGMGYVVALTTVFPNLFWDLHPAIQAGLPSYWLMKEIDPYAANTGFTFGYSMIAEAYLNFSSIGAPLAMSVMGYLLSAFVCWSLRFPDALKLALQAILMSFVLFVARAESHLIVRPIFWECLVPYWFILYLVYRRTRATAFVTDRPMLRDRVDGPSAASI
ncbi:MAG: O-antigen polysaccharide polymerase Wzy [Nitrospiraceae bacterium]|nr:O-antigen polysaccharide polymerase Wzy [Nitrospiraceae bacterium]